MEVKAIDLVFAFTPEGWLDFDRGWKMVSALHQKIEDILNHGNNKEGDAERLEIIHRYGRRINAYA